MAGLPGNGHLEGLGSLRRSCQAVVRRLPYQDKSPAGTILGICLRAKRPSLLAYKQQKAEILIPLFLKPLACIVHREYLAFGITAPATFYDGVIYFGNPSVGKDFPLPYKFDAGRNVRRHRVQMGAKDKRRMTGTGPVEQQVERSVANLLLDHFRSLKLLFQEKRQTPFFTRS